MKNWIIQLGNWSQGRLSWALLALSSAGLLISALTFQHVLGHAPCVMCIYQRNAVWGILFAALIGLMSKHPVARLSGFGLWLVSAAWGFKLAREHVDIIEAPNPFFAVCDAVPAFPSFMPLHEWLPSLFGAPGYCHENEWQFLEMGMPHWLIFIFSAYFIAGILFLLSAVYVWSRR